MALDHYVSQVHLRNFYSPKLGERMYGIRKKDLKVFRCRSEDVCRIEEGNTNKYLTDERAIEKFLTGVEPKYNGAVEKLRGGNPDKDAVYVVAAFVAYVATCSPAAMRINAAPMKNALVATAELLDKKGAFPKAPSSLGEKTVTELLTGGELAFNVDPKYPQAVGIEDILGRVANFGNAKWDLIINDAEGSPFFTSDFPLAIERGASPSVLNRVVPLAPDLAIRIMPGRDRPKDASFSGFEFSVMKLREYGVRTINKLIVQSAESLVFFRDEAEWVNKFVKRYGAFRIEPTTEKISTEKGFLIITGQKLVAHSA